ncbi:MAG: SDR family oxidoreductase [Geopsychrobacter sp.]|nr:SDR family oxidoreductase [Geopsychrobacter sp.]
MRILIFGISGMLGNAMYRVLWQGRGLEVYGTARSSSVKRFFTPEEGGNILSGIDVENQDALTRIFAEVKPQVVVNCIGLIKQLADANDPLQALPINAMLPHRLARLCELSGARLVHVSTDCIFAGTKGNYLETDRSDATDLYGMSKYLGEVTYAHTITLRTSIIGHELMSANALVGWFLDQEGRVSGYTRAYFSGLPTDEFAKIVRDVVLIQPKLSGRYHVASAPIAKYDLLKLVADEYGKTIDIVPDEGVKIDRSLNAERFREATGYEAPPWPSLVKQMCEFNRERSDVH